MATPRTLAELRRGDTVVLCQGYWDQALDVQIGTVVEALWDRVRVAVPDDLWRERWFSIFGGKGKGNEQYEIALVFDRASMEFRLATADEGYQWRQKRAGGALTSPEQHAGAGND